MSGIGALSAFFVLGALASGLSAIALLFPASPLDVMWRINPEGHAGLVALGGWGVTLMLLVSLACSASAWGLWRRARWGQRLAVGLLVVNLLGDLMNAVLRGDPRTLIGLPIGGLLIAYLVSHKVRGALRG